MSGHYPEDHAPAAWRYRHGCRHPDCTEEHRVQSARARSERRCHAAQDAPHGTWSGYANWGCRCGRCLVAGQLSNAWDRAVRKEFTGLSELERRAVAAMAQ